MTRDDIIRMALEAGLYGFRSPTDDAVLAALRFAALVAAAERDSFIAEIQAQIDHAVINDLRLVPNFGKRQGDLAVRVGNIEAVLDDLRARGQQ